MACTRRIIVARNPREHCFAWECAGIQVVRLGRASKREGVFCAIYCLLSDATNCSVATCTRTCAGYTITFRHIICIVTKWVARMGSIRPVGNNCAVRVREGPEYPLRATTLEAARVLMNNGLTLDVILYILKTIEDYLRTNW